MTPQQKAIELKDKFWLVSKGQSKEDAIFFAIVAVEEIINLPIFWADVDLHKRKPETYPLESTQEFWEEVLTNLKSMQ